MKQRIALIFLLLLGGFSHASAQLPAPAWLNKIKLTGRSGSDDHRLAVINNKTFSTGEANVLKVAGKAVTVKCLEIREETVLVQIQGLSGPCELTMAGDVFAVGKNPVAISTPRPIAEIEPPASVPVPPVKAFVPTAPEVYSQPIIRNKIFSPAAILFMAVIFMALVARIVRETGAVQDQLRKNINEGEARLADKIGKDFFRPHLLLNNLTLATARGTTQIDHVLVADTGIFVIETKHYSGWIFGNPQDSQWTQTFPRKKFRFQNPLHQNYGHVKTLQSLLDLTADHFHSVVVFTSDAEFKTDLGPNVVRLAGLIPFLSAERPALFDERKMAGIIGRIEMKRERRSLETDEYHINHVRNRLAGQTSKSRTHTVSRFPPDNSCVSVSEDDRYRPKC